MLDTVRQSCETKFIDGTTGSPIPVPLRLRAPQADCAQAKGEETGNGQVRARLEKLAIRKPAIKSPARRDAARPWVQRSLFRRIVTEYRRQPALDVSDFHPFARGVGLDLVFANRVHCEVVRVFMREVESADRCRGIHGEAFRQRDAGGLADL